MTSMPAVAATPLPKKQLFVLCVILFCEPFFATLLYPFVGFMVEGFGIAKDRADVGYYAGIIASSFSLAQFASSFLWGLVSDRIGRRPVLLIGLVGNVVTSILFGTSKNLAWAICARVACGLLNGNNGVAKTYLREITDATNQTRAFSFISLVWGAGFIAGPAAGGFLSQLSLKFPEAFPPGSLLDMFPYLMPLLLASGMSLVALIAGFFTLAESKASLMKGGIVVSKSDKELERLTSDNDEAGLDEKEELGKSPTSGFAEVEESEMKHLSVTDASGPDGLRRRSRSMEKREEGEGEQQKQQQEERMDFSSSDRLVEEKQQLQTRVYSRAELSAMPVDEARKLAPPPEALLRNRAFLFVVFGFALLRVTYNMGDELFSLWSMQPYWNGGLGFETNHIGIVQMTAGVASVVFQLVFFTPIVSRTGSLLAFRFAVFVAAPLHIILPFAQMTYFTDSPGAVWLVVVTVWMLRSFTASVMFTTTNIMQNNTLHPHVVGRGNGAAQSVAALATAAGPALGGALFSWSLTNDLGFPFNYTFVFNLCAALCVCIFLTVICIKPYEVDRPYHMDMALQVTGSEGKSEDVGAIPADAHLEA